MNPAVGTSFLNAAQAAKRDELPFLLVAAGTPDAPSRLREMGTHNERGFEQIRIGRLDRAATIAALAEPAEDSGRPFTEGAVRLVAEESQDYPYFIQLLGSAAWNAAEREGARTKSRSRRRDGASPRRRRRSRGSTAGGTMEAVKHRVDAALGPVVALLTRQRRAHRLRGAPFGPPPGRSRETPTDRIRIALLEKLSDLGVIWETADNRWELGIPSFGALRPQAAGTPGTAEADPAARSSRLPPRKSRRPAAPEGDGP